MALFSDTRVIASAHMEHQGAQLYERTRKSTYTCMYVYIYILYPYMYTSVYLSIYIYTYVYACMCIFIHIYTYMYMCIYIYTYIYIYTCMYMYIHIYYTRVSADVYVHRWHATVCTQLIYSKKIGLGRHTDERFVYTCGMQQPAFWLWFQPRGQISRAILMECGPHDVGIYWCIPALPVPRSHELKEGAAVNLGPLRCSLATLCSFQHNSQGILFSIWVSTKTNPDIPAVLRLLPLRPEISSSERLIALRVLTKKMQSVRCLP